jgi:anti-sigma B factor antagonist
MDLTLSTTAVDDCPVLSVGGEVDVYTAPLLREKVSDLLEATPTGSGAAHDLIIDLSGLAFIDSTGLGVLVAGRNQSLELGGALRLVCTQDRVLKLFRITGLDSVFDIYPTVDEAVAAARASR